VTSEQIKPFRRALSGDLLDRGRGELYRSGQKSQAVIAAMII
jgi:hypothetical protein